MNTLEPQHFISVCVSGCCVPIVIIIVDVIVAVVVFVIMKQSSQSAEFHIE